MNIHYAQVVTELNIVSTNEDGIDCIEFVEMRMTVDNRCAIRMKTVKCINATAQKNEMNHIIRRNRIVTKWEIINGLQD